MKELCNTLQVTESGYYYWRKHKISSRESRDTYLTCRIREIHQQVKSRYGAPRIHAELQAGGEKVSRKRVSRLMRENNITAKVKRRCKSTTDSNHTNEIAPNLLEQNFAVSAANQVWVADLTYIWTGEGWLYLAIILDLYSRMIVGWQICDRMTRELVIKAFLLAYWKRKPGKGLIHHSDRGSQYTSKDFQNLLTNVGAKSSMSGKGNCYDNAVAESFFHSLKTELRPDKIFKTKEEAKNAVFEYIEGFYNTKRRHSALNYCSPIDFEQYSIRVA